MAGKARRGGAGAKHREGARRSAFAEIALSAPPSLAASAGLARETISKTSAQKIRQFLFVHRRRFPSNSDQAGEADVRRCSPAVIAASARRILNDGLSVLVNTNLTLPSESFGIGKHSYRREYMPGGRVRGTLPETLAISINPLAGTSKGVSITRMASGDIAIASETAISTAYSPPSSSARKQTLPGRQANPCLKCASSQSLNGRSNALSKTAT